MMDDLISRTDVIDAIGSWYDSGENNLYTIEEGYGVAERHLVDRIKKLPPVRPTGHWIYKNRMIGAGVKYYTGEAEDGETHTVQIVDRSYADVGYCSVCGKRQGEFDNYCGFCGAKMEEQDG